MFIQEKTNNTVFNLKITFMVIMKNGWMIFTAACEECLKATASGLVETVLRMGIIIGRGKPASLGHQGNRVGWQVP